MRTGDTIAAISSAPGRSARAVVRLSGPGVGNVLARALGHDPELGASSARLRLDGGVLPVLVARYAGPRSYTGEDAAEVLLPGNPRLAEMVMARLVADGARQAEPGEFTARAYLAGKLTLDQAEGVAATIAAENAAQLRAAQDLLSGSAGDTYRSWADEIATLAALVEAGIDFTDQEDVVPIRPAALRARCGRVHDAIGAMLGAAGGAEAREGMPRAVLAGEPNAGKSTLFNALLGRRRAVTSDVPGTTRDLLSEPLHLGGSVPGAGAVLLVDAPGVDAAGAAPTAAPLDRAAMARGAEGIRGADVVIHCDPDGRFAPIDLAAPVIRVRTKADLPRNDGADARGLPICALDGRNLDVLRRAIADAAWSGGALALVPRHRRALARARGALAQAAARAGTGDVLPDPAEVADGLRSALDAVGELAGRVSPDDVIGRVFATFCVGK